MNEHQDWTWMEEAFGYKKEKMELLTEVAKRNALPMSLSAAYQTSSENRVPGLIVKSDDRLYWNHAKWEEIHKTQRKYIPRRHAVSSSEYLRPVYKDYTDDILPFSRPTAYKWYRENKHPGLLIKEGRFLFWNTKVWKRLLLEKKVHKTERIRNYICLAGTAYQMTSAELSLKTKLFKEAYLWTKKMLSLT